MQERFYASRFPLLAETANSFFLHYNLFRLAASGSCYLSEYNKTYKNPLSEYHFRVKKASILPCIPL